MDTILIVLAQAAPQPAPSWYATIDRYAPLLFIGVLFYLILIAPQRKKQKEQQRMINAVAKGDKVVTIGGILGTVTNVSDDAVTVKVDESTNTKLRFQKSALATIEPKSSLAAD